MKLNIYMLKNTPPSKIIRKTRNKLQLIIIFLNGLEKVCMFAVDTLQTDSYNYPGRLA